MKYYSQKWYQINCFLEFEAGTPVSIQSNNKTTEVILFQILTLVISLHPIQEDIVNTAIFLLLPEDNKQVKLYDFAVYI